MMEYYSKLGAIILCIFIVTIGSCTFGESALIAYAIARGADPIAARCGISGSINSGANQCLLISARKP